VKKLRSTLFVLPSFALHFFIVTLPACTLFYYSFTDWNGLGRPVFNALDNWTRMLKDASFHQAIGNTLVWMLLFLTVPLLLGLFVALLLTQTKRSQMAYRTIFFMPYVVPAVIAGKLFLVFYNPFLGIAQWFDRIGLHALGGISFIGNEKLALYAVAFVDNWHWWGFVMVLMLAALHQVDATLHEAAILDGAGRIRRFASVTIPQIMPTIMTLIMFTIIGSFLTFDYVWIMTQGGPAGATEIAATYIYKQSFLKLETGYASSLSLAIGLSCVAVYLALRVLQKRGVEV